MLAGGYHTDSEDIELFPLITENLLACASTLIVTTSLKLLNSHFFIF